MEAASKVPAVLRRSWERVIALLLGGLFVLSVPGILLFGGAVSPGDDLLESSTQVALAIGVAFFEVVLAMVVVRHAPSNMIGPVLAGMGVVIVLTNTVRPDAVPPLAGGWILLYSPLALILVLAPHGRLPSPVWRVTAGALGAVTVLFLVSSAAAAVWPDAAERLLPFDLVMLAALLVLLVTCASAPFARYRHADDDERIRLRWVLAAGLSLPLTLLLCWISYLVIGAPDLVIFGLLVMLLAIPGAVTIAVVRPDLFDVDRAMAIAVTVLVLSAAALGALSIVAAVTGAPLAESPPLLVAVATAAIVTAAGIAFPSTARGIERIIYPERGRALAHLRRLSKRVDAGEAEPEEIQGMLRSALHDPGLVVAYRRHHDAVLVGLDRRPLGSANALPVRVRGEQVGAIAYSDARAKRPAAVIARAAAPLIDVVRSRAELAQARDEARDSRERLLRAGYEERRRLERDLHDGAQQRLVALGMQLRVLQRSLVQQQSDIAGSLDAAVAQLGTAVAELRRLAHGVRPSALDDGLGPALAEFEQLAPDAIRIDVHAGPVPDDVATTAYFVVSEAIANALRHASATRIQVIVRHDGELLRVSVSDDGTGGAVPRGSGGLTNLRDRVSALGGRLQVDSPAGTGTVLKAELPCGS